MPRRNNPKAQRKGECKIDLYSEWLAHLKNASKTRLVLVKSKRAHDVLKRLGIKGTLYYTHANFRPEYRLIDFLEKQDKEVILLFDADRPGNSACEKLRAKLQQNGIKTNTRFRKILFGCEQKSLEGFLKYLHGHVANTPRKHEGLKY